ncbi:MAG: hypothetical protein FWF05_00950 [Oscillospiraceae bacterium]|nr:hypothetical protein [Oscillospiraceae bacterium]
MLAKFLAILMAIYYFFMPGAKPVPERVDIAGVTYRNGFLAEGLRYLNEENFYTKNIVFEERRGTQKIPYYRMECSTRDLVIRNSGKMWSMPNIMSERIYCRESQWEEVRTYYSNPDSFFYYYKPNGHFDENTIVLPSVDFAKFEALRQFSDDNAYGTGRNIGQTRRIPLAAWLAASQEPDFASFVFYKESNDGIFGAHTMEFHLWEGELVFHRYVNLSANGFAEFSILPADLEQYFRELIS